MSDTLITVIAIALAAILMFVFPLMTMSDRADDVSQTAVKAAVTSFVNESATKGKITKEDYNKLVQTITSTGNTYDVELSVQVRDSNLAKKKSLSQADKIGENIYYTVYTSQIQDKLDTDGSYLCKEGDIISAKAKNTNQTISDQLKNFFYSVTGNDSYSIAGEATAMVSSNGK